MAGYRNSKSYENESEGGSINVPDSLRFANTIDRDDYFTTNPSKLKIDVYVTVAGQLQRYNGEAFEDTSVVIKGDSGEDAPQMAIQYSATGNSGWQNTVNLSIHKYWRWSTDGGTTWSPDFVKFSGDGGSGVPEPYSMIIGANERLQLYKDGSLIQEQDETGSWILGNEAFHAGNAAAQATSLNSLTGNERLLASAVRDYPVMSETILGMAKLGATMSVNGNGELDTAISPTGIKIVADETARLAIPVSGGAILAIQQDTGFTYGIEASEDTSVIGNWRQIGTVATSVVSFNGRNGAVLPANGDYTQDQIKTVHDDTAVEGWFGIDNTGIYWNDGV